MTTSQLWKRLNEQVAEEAHRCGRDPSEITTIAVTKGRTTNQIQELLDAGCRHIGESRVQEALAKQTQLSQPGLAWHLIGTLQTNKLAKAASHFDLIHSVDRLPLAQELAHYATTPILLQVNSSGEATKHGWSPQALLDQYPTLPPLNIQGLMTIAPLDADSKQLSACFSSLRKLRDALATPEQPLPHLSMGMSRDFPIAIAEGATLLRIGSALFTNSL